MLYYTGPLLNTVAALLDTEVGKRLILRYFNDGKVELKLDTALQAIKEEVVSFCREYLYPMEELTKYAVKAIAREVIGNLVAMTITREGTRQVTKVATRQVTTVAAKSAIKTAANLVGIASDIAQTSLEAVGYKKLGTIVGITGNVVSGAMLGGAVGGPAGATVGALLGFGAWGVGQVTGRLVDRTFGE